MNIKSIVRCSALLAALLPLASAATAQTPPLTIAYTVADLGTLGGQYGIGAGLNNAGQVAGTYYSPSDAHFVTVLTGAAGTAPFKVFGVGSSGGPVNSSGQVAGNILTASGTTHAFLSGPQGTGLLKDLGSLGSDGFSHAFGVNTRGQVTGFSSPSAFGISVNHHAFLSGPSGGGPLKDLGTLGGISSDGYGVNDSGQVCGAYELPNFTQHAFLSGPNGGPLTDLGSLTPGGESAANKVNIHGQVTGFADTPTGFHAFLSGPNGVRPLRDLGSLAGTHSRGNDVNAAGTVVGTTTVVISTTNPYGVSAFVFINDTMTDLNAFVAPDSGITLDSGLAISDSGFILASGTTNGEAHTYLLTPTAAPPVNLGPNLVVTAISSVLVNTFGTRYINVNVTNNGALYADQVQITGISVNGATPPSGDIHNILPTIPDLLTPGASLDDTVVYQLPLTATRAALIVSGIYIDPRTNGTGHFSSAIRLVLPPPAR